MFSFGKDITHHLNYLENMVEEHLSLENITQQVDNLFQEITQQIANIETSMEESTATPTLKERNQNVGVQSRDKDQYHPTRKTKQRSLSENGEEKSAIRTPVLSQGTGEKQQKQTPLQQPRGERAIDSAKRKVHRIQGPIRIMGFQPAEMISDQVGGKENTDTMGQLSRKDLLLLYKQNKLKEQDSKKKKPFGSTSNSGTVSVDIVSLKNKLKTAIPTNASTENENSISTASNLTPPTKIGVKRNVDTRRVQAAGEKAVAPGTPIHALQKRLKAFDGGNPLHNGNNKVAVSSRLNINAKVRISPKSFAKLKKETTGAHAQHPSVTKYCNAQLPSKLRKEVPSAEIRTKISTLQPMTNPSILETLLLRVAEANQLAQMGSSKAATMLLEAMLDHKETALVSVKALYWMARSKILEDSGNIERAEAMLDIGFEYVKGVEDTILTVARDEFRQRISKSVAKDVNDILGDSPVSDISQAKSAENVEREIDVSPILQQNDFGYQDADDDNVDHQNKERLDYQRIGTALTSHIQKLELFSPGASSCKKPSVTKDIDNMNKTELLNKYLFDDDSMIEGSFVEGDSAMGSQFPDLNQRSATKEVMPFNIFSPTNLMKSCGKAGRVSILATEVGNDVVNTNLQDSNAFAMPPPVPRVPKAATTRIGTPIVTTASTRRVGTPMPKKSPRKIASIASMEEPEGKVESICKTNEAIKDELSTTGSFSVPIERLQKKTGQVVTTPVRRSRRLSREPTPSPLRREIVEKIVFG